ncbi:MAG: hypothetical protein CM1200mP24_00910 [Gammaproteobacteria bacterium]|nr:MAG: hypothetical protein CM1200mP24_00910 [Gammaproteobacteria bacterium]
MEPEGRILVIDSDWGFVLVEPWSMLETRRFFEAAGPALGNQILVGSCPVC